MLSPIVTRLFDPSSFGAFIVLTSIAMVLTPILSLRLELAVPLPEHEASAWALLHTGLFLSFVGAGILSVLFAVAAPRLLDGPVADWIWVTPIMAAAMAIFAVLNAMAVRHSRYTAIARRNVLMVLSSLGLQIGAGLMGYGVGGLVLGFALGQIVGASSLMFGSGLRSSHARAGRRAALMIETVRRYRRIPTLLAFAGVINVLGFQAPVFLLAQFFSADVVGWFGLTQRVLSAPVSLIGVAVAQVYLSEIARLHREQGQGEAEYFFKASKALGAFGVALAIVLLCAAPTIFEVIFGSAYEESGHYARAMSIALAAQMIASPLSQTLVVYERAALQLSWDGLRLLVVCVTGVAARILGFTPEGTIWLLGGALALMHAVSWELSRRTITGTSGTRKTSSIPI